MTVGFSCQWHIIFRVTVTHFEVRTADGGVVLSGA
jgi:hypothetical protein